MERPTPKDEQIKLDPKKYIVSKTDRKGIITYGNDYFVEISGYKESELIGQPHSIIRHPDMPKVIFKLLWERVLRGDTIWAVVKNLAKDGRYYWVISEFVPSRNKITGEVNKITAYRKAAPEKVIKEIEPLYKKLKEIEEESGVEGSEKYLMGWLEEKGTNYDDYINGLIGNKGIFALFFKAMKKIFGGDHH